jgi:hypothetical protein
MSNLQDEETPIMEYSMSEQSSDEKAWGHYKQAHPSIIDKLFTGMQKTIV